ncbi:MAG: hypothetical protein ACRC6V_09520 [Bacteroidales bacterium]
MKTLLLLIVSLFSVQVSSSGLDTLDKNKPVIYVVNQDSIAAFYGSQTSSYLTTKLDGYHVYAYYVNLDFESNQSDASYIAGTLIQDIRRINPEIVFTHSNILGKALRKSLPEFTVINFSYEDNSRDFTLEDPALKLVNILKMTHYDYNKIYVLHDLTSKSKLAAADFIERLILAGVNKTKVEFIENKSVVYLESNLRALNLKPRSVLVNMIYTLDNTETGKSEYAPDIKEKFARINRKHLDIGFYRSSSYNECIVFDHSLSRIREYVERLGKEDILLKPLEVRASFSLERMDRLKLKSYYLKGLSEMDDIIK